MIARPLRTDLLPDIKEYAINHTKAMAMRKFGLGYTDMTRLAKHYHITFKSRKTGRQPKVFYQKIQRLKNAREQYKEVATEGIKYIEKKYPSFIPLMEELKAHYGLDSLSDMLLPTRTDIVAQSRHILRYFFTLIYPNVTLKKAATILYCGECCHSNIITSKIKVFEFRKYDHEYGQFIKHLENKYTPFLEVEND